MSLRYCLRTKDNLELQKEPPEFFCKKDVLRNFTKFTGKHLCQYLFFNKVAGLRPSTLLKQRLWHRCFPVDFVKLLRITFFTKHLRWLLLEEELKFLLYSILGSFYISSLVFIFMIMKIRFFNYVVTEGGFCTNLVSSDLVIS